MTRAQMLQLAGRLEVVTDVGVVLLACLAVAALAFYSLTAAAPIIAMFVGLVVLRHLARRTAR